MGGGLAFRRWFGHCQCLKVNYLFQLMSSVITPIPLLNKGGQSSNQGAEETSLRPDATQNGPKTTLGRRANAHTGEENSYILTIYLGKLWLRSSLPTYVGRFGGCLSIYGQAVPEPPFLMSDKHYSVSMSRKLSLRKSLDTHFLPVCQRYCLWTTN